MRFLSTLAALATACALPAQNFVTNGDFSAGLTGWTQGGYSCVSGVQSFDVDGRGPSASFYCMPGGQTAPSPYPPNTIEQSVLLVQGIDYEFSCDLSVYRPVATGNADGGTIYVEVNGVEIARVAFGSYAAGEIKRAKLCARFVPGASGMLPLRIHFHRNYTCSTTTPTPHTALDNVSLQLATGPTFCFRGNLKVGTTLTAATQGPAGAPFAVFVSSGVLASPISIPSISGYLWLDPVTLATLFTGTFDAGGKWTATFPVPNLSVLTLLPTWFQGAHLLGATGALGFHSSIVFVK